MPDRLGRLPAKESVVRALHAPEADLLAKAANDILIGHAQREHEIRPPIGAPSPDGAFAFKQPSGPRDVGAINHG